MSENHSPFAQFVIKPLIDLSAYNFDITFTNSSLFMVLSILIILSFMALATRKMAVIPSRMQSCAELLYEFTEDMLVENAGEEGKKYFSVVFTLFLFVLISNLLGMFPYGFTVTSHLTITFALAAIIFISVTIISLFHHGLKFFSVFLPEGTPLWLAPLMIVIELFAYLSKPVSLSVRLAANMIAGHVLLKVIAGFIVMLGLIWGFVPMPLVILLVGFEIFVALLQAYIFTILTCVYLGNALHLH